jgi:6-oxo-cyclohex-1-ene-carbonyl-CoA hydrolase
MSAPNHDLAPMSGKDHVLYERRPVKGKDGKPVDGLYSGWISLNNPGELNSYTTEMVKDVILAFRNASNDMSLVSVVFTGTGDRAFCTGGNTREYAEVYAGSPDRYKSYMRLFNDMVTAILHCDKPVICRANGMRVAGGQEIGMACDFTLASDLAVFGQAGPIHGSAPDGGSTDFLPLYIGIEAAMASGVLCELWSAHKAHRMGLITDQVPVLKQDGEFLVNPQVITDRWVDDGGRIVYGERKSGDEYKQARALVKQCEQDFSLLDEAVDRLTTTFLYMFPGCVSKTIGSLRKHKLAHWDKNRESNREWLGLNMLTEAKAGFRAFNEGPRNQREIDFIELRRAMARDEAWSDDLLERILPKQG